jgi:hypothetical protein
MEGTLIGKPANALFKMIIYMQQWRLKDRCLVNAAMGAIRRLHASLSADVP